MEDKLGRSNSYINYHRALGRVSDAFEQGVRSNSAVQDPRFLYACDQLACGTTRYQHYQRQTSHPTRSLLPGSGLSSSICGDSFLLLL